MKQTILAGQYLTVTYNFYNPIRILAKGQPNQQPTAHKTTPSIIPLHMLGSHILNTTCALNCQLTCKLPFSSRKRRWGWTHAPSYTCTQPTWLGELGKRRQSEEKSGNRHLYLLTLDHLDLGIPNLSAANYHFKNLAVSCLPPSLVQF